MSYGYADFVGFSKSKARRAILAIFFTNPEQEYFSRQLERITRIYAANLQRELVRMEKSGLIISRRLGTLKLYKLDKKHPLYTDLKSLITKTVGLEETIRSELSSIKGIQAACIYGSFASKEERPASDIDILVLGKIDEKVLIQAVKRMEKRLQREINYSIYNLEDWEKRKADIDPFVIEVIRCPKIPLIGDPDAFI